MELAKIDDKLVIKVLGIDPDGVPDAIKIEYLRDGHPIENHPAFTGSGWAALRIGALKLIGDWWVNQYWTVIRGYTGEKQS